MSYFNAPSGWRVLRGFIIRRDQSGRWLVAETPSWANVRAFRSRDATEWYAVSKAAGDYDRVHFLLSQV
jgi:hypothetical protein